MKQMIGKIPFRCGMTLLAIFFLLLAGCRTEEPFIEEEQPVPGESVPEELTVDTLMFRVRSDACELEVNVKSNCAWSVTVETDETDEEGWLSADMTEGAAGDTTLVLRVSDNLADEGRTGTVIIASQTLQHELTVRQQPASQLIATDREYDISVYGETITVELKTNTEIEFSVSDGTWIAAVAPMRLHEVSYTFVVAPNYSAEPRQGIITFTTADGTVTEDILLFQTRREIRITGDCDCTLPSGEGNLLIELLSSVEDYVCEISDEATGSTCDWILAEGTPVRNGELYTHRFVVSANETDAVRRAEIIFRIGDTADKFTVEQQPAPVEEQPDGRHLFKIYHTGTHFQLPDIEGIMEYEGIWGTYYAPEGTVDWGDGSTSPYIQWGSHDYTPAYESHCISMDIENISWFRLRNLSGVTEIDLSEF